MHLFDLFLILASWCGRVSKQLDQLSRNWNLRPPKGHPSRSSSLRLRRALVVRASSSESSSSSSASWTVGARKRALLLVDLELIKAVLDLLAYAFSSRCLSLFLSRPTFSSFPSFLLLLLPSSCLSSLLNSLVPLANVRSFERRRAAARRSPLLNARRRANLVIFYAPRVSCFSVQTGRRFNGSGFADANNASL